MATGADDAGDGGHELVPVLEGAEGVALDVGEGGRVDDEEVEHAAALAELLEQGEHVAGDRLDGLGVHAGGGEVLAAARVAAGGGVDVGDRAGAGSHGAQAEGAGEAEEVADAAAADLGLEQAATLAEVEEQAGRDRGGDVDQELEAVLGDLELGRGGLAGKVEGGRAAVVGGGDRTDAVLHVDAGGLEFLLEHGDEGVEVALGAAGVLVDEEVVAEAVDGEAGEAVGLVVEEADGALPQHGRPAQAQGLPDAGRHLGLVPGEVGGEAEHADTDRPLGLDEAPADAVAVLVDDGDDGALGEVVEVAANGVAKHPGVTGADQAGDLQRDLDAGSTHRRSRGATSERGVAARGRGVGVGRALAGTDAAVPRGGAAAHIAGTVIAGTVIAGTVVAGTVVALGSAAVTAITAVVPPPSRWCSARGRSVAVGHRRGGA